MNRILCIFPKNETTDFLSPIYDCLSQFPNFAGYRDYSYNQSFNSCLNAELEKIEEDTLVIFLGHGASNRLYGSKDKDGQMIELFNKTNTKWLKHVHFVGVACKSKEFASNFCPNYIGFGDIVSEFSEIRNARILEDPNYMEWAKEEDIANFRIRLTQIIVNAISLSKCDNLLSISKMLNLCFNKQIAELLIQKSIPNYRDIADLLFDVMTDLEFVTEKRE